MSYPRFEIKRNNNAYQSFHFVLKAENAEVILNSEMYSSKQAALTGIDSVKRHAPDENNYERKTSTSNEPYFVLKASNGEIIGTSEMYSSTANRDNGIRAVQRDAPKATIVDQS